MGCFSCGGAKIGANRRLTLIQDAPLTNDRGMYPMIGDEYECEPYHGAYLGTTMYLVGYGTEHESLFTRNRRGQAENFARQHQLSAGLISVTQLCHDRVVELLGA